MCGRFTLQITKEMMADIFGITVLQDIQPRYNIAPTQQVAAIRTYPDGTRHLDQLHWGLIPSWATDPSIGNKMINARSETVNEKPSFKYALHKHRCIIPASEFYEWVVKKHPLYVHLKDNSIMAFAGLWDHWKSPKGQIIESCTILTTTSNNLLKPIHDRMPVILDRRDINIWLNSNIIEIESLKYLFEPYTSGQMEMYPVSDIVNSPRNDILECILPISF